MKGETILLDDGIEQMFAKPDFSLKCVHLGIQGDYGYSSLKVTKSSWMEIRRRMESFLEDVDGEPFKPNSDPSVCGGRE